VGDKKTDSKGHPGKWHIYAHNPPIFIAGGSATIGDSASDSSGDIFTAGLGMFPHASNYHHSTSVSPRSAGTVVGSAFEPEKDTKPAQGWAASTAETPQDQSAGLMAANAGKVDADPLEVKAKEKPH
jgi:hypothetical protein